MNDRITDKKNIFYDIYNKPVDVIEYWNSLIKNDTPIETYLGTDSLKVRKSRYVFYVVIVFRFEKSGAHYLHKQENFDHFNTVEDKLRKEIEFTMDFARYFRSNGLEIDFLEFDFNDKIKTKSSMLVPEAEGWARMDGFTPLCKMEDLLATRAADHLCTRERPRSKNKKKSKKS